KDEGNLRELQSLSLLSQEITAALSQFKGRLVEIEEEISLQNWKFDELAKVKANIEAIAKKHHLEYKVYRVCQADSLEKIARQHKTTVEKIKKLNDLQQDFIVAGQALKIPAD